MILDLGFEIFGDFVVIAYINKLVLGAYFLKHYSLLLDIKKRC